MSTEQAQGKGWFMLAKPAGVPVFPPHADPDGDCVLHRWRTERPGIMGEDWPEGFSGGIAHRLDVPTSGQVLAAASPDALAAIRAAFSSGALEKRYVFISDGDVPWDSHTVTTPIAHDKRRKSRMIVQRGTDTPHRGRWYPAHTELLRVAPVPGGGWVWSAVITSGVMHQIRVHSASVGIVLRGDHRYGGGPVVTDVVPFWLHHLGLRGPNLAPPMVPVPGGWPVNMGDLE